MGQVWHMYNYAYTIEKQVAKCPVFGGWVHCAVANNIRWPDVLLKVLGVIMQVYKSMCRMLVDASCLCQVLAVSAPVRC